MDNIKKTYIAVGKALLLLPALLIATAITAAHSMLKIMENIMMHEIS